jgi:hypothetical protein
MSVEEVGKAFIAHYYATRDTNPSLLTSLYNAQSVLTFEGVRSEGPAAIVEKFTKLGQVYYYYYYYYYYYFYFNYYYYYSIIDTFNCVY